MATPTALEIVDTAVKVGLGALISSVSGFALAKASHSNALAKEKLERRYRMIEAIAAQVEEFTHTALKSWSLVTEWTRFEERGKQWEPDRLAFAESLKDELFHSFKNLSSAEGHLMLLGENVAQKCLRDYGEAVTGIARNAYVGRSGLTEAEMLGHRKKMLSLREALFEELSKAYRRTAV